MYGADKLGKLVLDTKEKKFLDSMKEHYENETKIGMTQVHEAERLLNNHSFAWCKILGIGSLAGENQPQRIKDAMRVDFNSIPSMLGLRKDHKEYDDSTKVPSLRPL